MLSICIPQATRRSVGWNFTSVFLFLLGLTWLTIILGDSPPPSHAARKSNYLSGFANTKQESIFSEARNLKKSKSSLLKSCSVKKLDDGALCFCSKTKESTKKEYVLVSTNENCVWDACQVTKKATDGDSKKNPWIPVEGLYGIYSVPSGTIWVLITGSQLKYEAPSIEPSGRAGPSWFRIRHVTSMELVHMPCRILSLPELKEEVRQVQLLRKALKKHKFYYVDTGDEDEAVVRDMTKCLQQAFGEHEDDSSGPAQKENATKWWQDTDSKAAPSSRFFWNEAAIQPLLQRYHEEKGSLQSNSSHPCEILMNHIKPLTSAFVGVSENITIPGSKKSMVYDQVVISRRGRFRVGTRFTKRGADATGAVANYAETEQICFLREKKSLRHVASHVQTRGSIPLRWSSPTDIKSYRPRIRIGTDPLAQTRALLAHIVDQLSSYSSTQTELENPKLVFLNLIDKKSDQGRLGRAFDAVLNAVVDVYTPNASSTLLNSTTVDNQIVLAPNSVKHVWFDFHAEVKHGRWERLGSLLESLRPTLLEHGFFSAIPPSKTSGWKIESRQHAVVRTNCMDCLDRTNVVQSMIGRMMLVEKLNNLTKGDGQDSQWTAFQNNSMSLPWDNGEIAHRLLWADNADAISQLYAGTPALKRDFTRTGKRTRLGALDDGVNSLQRYYLNNFIDSDRQEGMDLMVGHTEFSNADAATYPDIVAYGSSPSVSLQEAARKMLQEGLMGKSEHPSSERSYARIKYPKAHHNNRPLALRWLPGDLNSHVRSQASILEKASKDDAISSEFSSMAALYEIDRRSQSDLPWWVIAESSESEESSILDEHQHQLMDRERGHSTGTNNAGFVLSSLIIGTRAPLSMAALVVGMLGVMYFPTHDETPENEGNVSVS